MDSILNLTKKDMDKLSERYGDLFMRVYKKELEQTMDRQEAMEALLAKRNESKDTRPYGSLLDKYIR